MKPSKRLRPIIDKARESEQVTARVLTEACDHLDSAEQKLAELKTYRNEYIEGLQYKSSAGLNAMQMKDYQAFLGRLDEAIGQQQQILAGLEQEAGIARQNWMQEKQRLSALDKLNERHANREQAESERHEQAESSEHSLRQWRRVPG